MFRMQQAHSSETWLHPLASAQVLAVPNQLPPACSRAMIETQVKRARTDGAEDVSGALAGSELQRGEDGEAVKIALAGPSRLKPALLEAKPDPLATKAFAESDRLIGERAKKAGFASHGQPFPQGCTSAVQAK